MPEPVSLRCLRWDEEGDARLRALTPACWQALGKRIGEGEGQHLLARRLQRADIEAPTPIAAGLRARAMAIAGRNLQGCTELARAIRETGRPALLLKGVDLGERLYGNLGHRPMGDVDLLVHPEDAMAYHAWFAGQRYSVRGEPTPAMMALAREHHLIYVPQEQGMPFELHWRLAHAHNDGPIDRDAIWDRAIAHPLAPGARVMAAEDLFLYLCLHLKHHTFETSLTQLWDLAEMLDCAALPIDWEVAWRRAEAWRMIGAVRVVLHLLTRTLGVATSQISTWQPDAGLAAQLPDLLPRLGRHPLSLFAQDRFSVLLSNENSSVERLGALGRGFFPPRAEVRAAYGRSNDGAWHDLGSYLHRYWYLLRTKGGTIGNWIAQKAVREKIDGVAALRRYLDTSG